MEFRRTEKGNTPASDISLAPNQGMPVKAGRQSRVYKLGLITEISIGR